MQTNRWLQTLIVLLVIIASAWLLGQVWVFLIQFSSLILLFFLAWLLAFVLSPIARALQRRGVPKTLSVVIVYLALALLFSIGGWLLLPPVTDQVSKLQRNFFTYTNIIGGVVLKADETLQGWGINKADLTKVYNDLTSQVQGVIFSAIQNTFSLLQSFATFALQFVLVLILSFYFMKDGDRIFGGMLQMLPPRWQDEARLVAISLEKSFGGFIRGQLVFALAYALLTAVVMVMPPFQLDFVIVASIVSGLCMIIPLIGNFLAFLPPILVALVTPGKEGLVWWLLFALFIMQSIMMNVLGPRIMSSAIGIHPLYVVGAMLLGAQVAGVWGALFGIPIAGAINLIGRPVMRRVRYQTTLYKEAELPSLATSAFLTGPLAATMAQTGLPPTTPTTPVAPAGAEQETSVLTGAAQALGNTLGTPPPMEASTRQATVRRPPSPPPHAVDDYIVPRSPTLTLRAWRLAFSLLSRARNKAAKRVAQARASRQ